MFKILKWLIFFFISTTLVIFAMANRNDVELSMPISDLTINVPLYVIFFGNIVIGIILSSLFSMKSKVKNHFVKRSKNKEISALKNEISGIHINNDMLTAQNKKE